MAARRARKKKTDPSEDADQKATDSEDPGEGPATQASGAKSSKKPAAKKSKPRKAAATKKAAAKSSAPPPPSASEATTNSTPASADVDAGWGSSSEPPSAPASAPASSPASSSPTSEPSLAIPSSDQQGGGGLARLRVFAMEEGRRIRDLAERQRLNKAAGGNETARRALVMAEWLNDVARTFAGSGARDEIERRQRLAAAAAVDRLWRSRIVGDANLFRIIAIADLLELCLKRDVDEAQHVLRLVEPGLGNINTELVRMAAQAWSEGKRRGPVRVLFKALGLEPPSDETIDIGLAERSDQPPQTVRQPPASK